MSVKAVAVVSLWCVQSESDRLLNFAFNFLWNFFWKIVSSPTSDSEVCLACSLRTCMSFWTCQVLLEFVSLSRILPLTN